MDARIRVCRTRLVTLLLLVLVVTAEARADIPVDTLLLQLREDTLAPDEREEAIEILSVDDSADTTHDLIEVLDPGGNYSSRPIGSRISALRALVARADPESANALARTFIRSRLGSLPEDPDLFERALRALVRFDDGTVETAILEGLLPELEIAARNQLLDHWLESLGGSSELRDRLEAGTLAPTSSTRPILHADIRTAFERHGRAWVEAFATERGSSWTALVDRVQAEWLSDWLGSGDPRIVEWAALTVRAMNISWPEVGRSLASTLDEAPEIDEWREARVAATDALDHMGEFTPWPALEPPTHLPGHTPGLEYQPTPPPAAAVDLRGGPHPPLKRHGTGLLLSLCFCLVCGWVGTRTKRSTSRRIAALGFGTGLLFTLESSLRSTGFSPAPPPLFSFDGFDAAPLLERQRDGNPWLETAGGSIRHQVFDQDFDGDRVVVLGASSVHGSHYLLEETFSERLNHLLETTHNAGEQRPVEVLNFGIGGTLSDGIRHTGLQALSLGADLIIIYYGHNEVSHFVQLERFAQIDSDSLSSRMALSRTAIGRGLGHLFSRSTDGSLSDAGEAIFSPNPPRRTEVDNLTRLAALNLRWNLSILLDAAGNAGIPVILCQVATNYRFSHLDAFTSTGTGDSDDLDSLLDEAEAASEAGEHARARALWQSAIDRSASPREAHTAIRDAITELATEHDVTLIDVNEALYHGSPDGLSVSGLFWDDLHPTVQGHAVIADLLLEPTRSLLGRD